MTGLTTEGKELSRIVIPSSYSIVDTVTEDYKFQNRNEFDEFRWQVMESGDRELDELLMKWEMDRMEQGKYDEWPATFTRTIPIYGYGNEVNITTIGRDAFRNSNYLKTIIIPNSVTHIGELVFSGCESLISIIVDDANTTYDSRDNCNAIIERETNTLIAGCQNTIIPHTVTSIGDEAFRDCSGLTGALTIPDSVTSIGDEAFYGCDNLTSIIIPDSVKSIGSFAFASCSGLTSVSLGDSVTSIGDSAFRDCSGLTGVLTIPDSVTSIGDYAFCWCRSLTSIIIPDSVTSIGVHAFSNCSGLTSVTIPDSVTSIGSNAFYNCYKLVQVRNLSGQTLNGLPSNVGQEILTDETSAFTKTLTNEGKYQTFVVEDKKYLMGFTAEADRTTADDIPNDITDIYQNAFFGCSSLTSVSLGDSVTSIGDRAFENCSSLTSIIIPDSVTSIGDGAFRDCSSLTSVSLGDSVTSIGDGAFNACDNLTSVYYIGSSDNWNGISVGSFNTSLTNANRYYITFDESNNIVVTDKNNSTVTAGDTTYKVSYDNTDPSKVVATITFYNNNNNYVVVATKDLV